MLTMCALVFESIRDAITSLQESVRNGLKSLEHVDRCLWILLALKFLESYAYFALSQILVIYLHTEFGFNDIEAGTIYGGWGLSITIAGLSLACLTDSLGVRYALLIGFAISTVSYICLSLFVYSRVLIYIFLFFLLPVGGSLGIPMLTIGIRRFTDNSNMGFAFGLFYTVMNIAAFVSGPVIDIVNYGKQPDEIVLCGLTGNRIVILTCAVCEIVAFGVTYRYLVVPTRNIDERETEMVSTALSQHAMLHDDDDVDEERAIMSGLTSVASSRDNSINNREKVEMRAVSVTSTNSDVSEMRESEDDEDDEDVKDNSYTDTSITITSSNIGSSRSSSTDSTAKKSILDGEEFSLHEVQQLVYSRTFWRFMALSLFLLNLRAIFRHLDATFPTYLVREHGSHIPKGLIYSINPFMIIVLTPFIAAGMAHITDYDMIKAGSWITGISCFPLALSSTIPAAIIFVILLSLGEALWSPSYAMTVAPVGKEATFSALASAPLFAAKVPVGLMSGYLLSTYMPEQGTQRPRVLWFIIGLLTLSSAVCITVFEKCVREPSPPGVGDEQDRSVGREGSGGDESDTNDGGGNPLHTTGGTKGSTKRGGLVYDQLDGSSNSLIHHSGHDDGRSTSNGRTSKSGKSGNNSDGSGDDIGIDLSSFDIHTIMMSEQEEGDGDDSIADLMKKYS